MHTRLVRVGRYAVGAHFARLQAGSLAAAIDHRILVRLEQFHLVQQIGIGHFGTQRVPDEHGHVLGGAWLLIQANNWVVISLVNDNCCSAREQFNLVLRAGITLIRLSDL